MAAHKGYKMAEKKDNEEKTPKGKKAFSASSITKGVKKIFKTKNTGKGNRGLLSFFQTRLGLVIGTVVLILVLMLGVFTLGIYKFGWDDDATLAFARVAPIPGVFNYPAFFVNGKEVSYAEYQDYKKAYTTYIKEFYIKGEKKIDVNSDEAKQILSDANSRIKDLLVKNIIIETEVKKRKNIKYTQKDIDNSFKDFVSRTGGDKEVANNLKKYYGLTEDRFKTEFYYYTFLSGKLQNDIQNDKTLNADAEKKANEVLAKVKKGEDFAELAKKYSEDTTASKGGDLGFVKKGQLVPQFEDALWKLQPGQTSDLVQTVYGYHIIKLVAVNGDERQASHILIKTKDYDSWLSDLAQKAKVKSLVKLN